MPILVNREVLLACLSWFLCTIFVGIVIAWAWMIRRLWMRRPLFPEEPLCAWHAAPWGFGTVLLVIILHGLTQLAVVSGYSHATGRARPRPASPQHPVLTGEATARSPQVAGSPEATPGTHSGRPESGLHVNQSEAPAAGGPRSEPAQRNGERRAAIPQPSANDSEVFSRTEQMFLVAVVDSMLLVLIPLLARFTAGARMRDYGLCGKNLSRQLVVGTVAILITFPLVYTVQFASVRVWKPKGHPLEVMLREQFSPEVAYLAVVTAVGLAPALEELIFRAIFLTWLSKHEKTIRSGIRWLAQRAFGAGPSSAPQTDLPRDSHLPELRRQTGIDALADADDPDHPLSTPDPRVSSNAAPAPEFEGEFALPQASVPPKLTQPTQLPVCAIVLTSVLFGAVHAPQWPAPIPIFVLALALGTVFAKTHALLAPIVMHAIFNGVSTAVLFVVLLLGPMLERGVPKAKDLVPDARISGACAGEGGVPVCDGSTPRGPVSQFVNPAEFFLDERHVD
jgi:membrane protease YdiL (CAAX protease family)